MSKKDLLFKLVFLILVRSIIFPPTFKPFFLYIFRIIILEIPNPFR